MTGRVVLIGGGPGAPDLLTVRATNEIARADVVLADRLAPDVTDLVRADCEMVDVGKIPRGEFTPQEQINQLLLDHARAGRHVVRLKGGDPYVFGRGGEEAIICREAGIEVEEVPGITSAIAAPAAVGIPVTHRGLAQGFTVVSGHLPPGHTGSDIDWAALARTGTSLVIMMGVLRLPEICAALVAGGLAADTPAVCIERAFGPEQREISGTVSDIADRCRDAEVVAPATTIIGQVAGLYPGS